MTLKYDNGVDSPEDGGTMRGSVIIDGYVIKAKHVPVYLRTEDESNEKGIGIRSLTKPQAEAMAQAYGEAMKERFMWMWKRSGGK